MCIYWPMELSLRFEDINDKPLFDCFVSLVNFEDEDWLIDDFEQISLSDSGSEDLELSDDTQQMLSLGLPLAFGEARKPRKHRKSKKTQSDNYEHENESQDLDFTQFWEINGSKILEERWFEKYGNYVDSNYCEQPAIDVEDVEVPVTDYAQEWAAIWEDHCNSIYWEEFSKYTISCASEQTDEKEGNDNDSKDDTPSTSKADESNNSPQKVVQMDKAKNDAGGEDNPPSGSGNNLKSAHEEEADDDASVRKTKSALKAAGLEAKFDRSNKMKSWKVKVGLKTKAVKNRFKKFKKMFKENPNLIWDEANSENVCCKQPSVIKENRDLKKFWKRRYSLFSKYDLGIQMDKESWYSVTPEKLATHQAKRCQTDIIVDTCCGVGGNAIQFAKRCNHVIAIDIDGAKLEMAKHNASLYGVQNKIEFIQGDCLSVLNTMCRADIVFVDPPWGGTDVNKSPVFHLKDTTPNTIDIVEAAKRLTDNIALFLPRNTNSIELAYLAGVGKSVEIEKNYVYDRLLTITAYYGNLIHNECDK